MTALARLAHIDLPVVVQTAAVFAVAVGNVPGTCPARSANVPCRLHTLAPPEFPPLVYLAGWEGPPIDLLVLAGDSPEDVLLWAKAGEPELATNGVILCERGADLARAWLLAQGFHEDSTSGETLLVRDLPPKVSVEPQPPREKPHMDQKIIEAVVAALQAGAAKKASEAQAAQEAKAADEAAKLARQQAGAKALAHHAEAEELKLVRKQISILVHDHLSPEQRTWDLPEVPPTESAPEATAPEATAPAVTPDAVPASQPAPAEPEPVSPPAPAETPAPAPATAAA